MRPSWRSPFRAGIPSLGAIALQGTSQTINGPGSFLVSSIGLSKTSTLFIDNSAGPVTLYVVGNVSVKDGSIIDVADPKPEKLAIYVAGNDGVELAGAGRLEGVVYAPHSTVTLSGNAEFRGAVVGNVLNMSSTTRFPLRQHAARPVGPAS